LWQQSITVMTNSYKYSSFRCTEHPNNNTLAREPLVERAAYDPDESARLSPAQPEPGSQPDTPKVPVQQPVCAT
jgi:hypothetical protein